jgi:hypothetical protein
VEKFTDSLALSFQFIPTNPLRLQTLNFDDIYFRYNPAVLVVNLELEDNSGRVIETVLPILKRLYKGMPDSVSSITLFFHSC